MSITSEMSASSALAPYADGFAKELSRRGYAPSSVKEKVRLLAQVGVWLDERGLDLRELPRAVGEFVASRREAGHTTHRSMGSLRPMLEFLERQGAIEPVVDRRPSTALEVLLDRYAGYLASERGLAPGTVRAYVDSVRPFLAGRDVDGELDVTAADVTTFVLERCRHGSRSSAKQTVNTLRSLLRFLHVEGLLSGPLVGAVPTVASWRLAGLPQGLEPGQVSRLLAACDRRTAAGRRDHAIVLLLVRLGLRAAEVAGLELDDADWRAGELAVSGKGHRRDRLPLPDDVGHALVGYLQRGRPATDELRSMFVTLNGPHRALTPPAISAVVLRAGRRAGLDEVRAHRLRHTAATQLLAAGAPLDEIGQLLRHRHALTTAIYAKADRKALRIVARPWPGGAA